MHRVCSVQNGRRTLLSRRACFYADEIYARASADRRTDRVSLPLCSNSLVAIFEPFLFPSHIHQVPIRSLLYFRSFAFPPSVLFLPLSVNLPPFSLSLALRYPPHLHRSFFFFFVYFPHLSFPLASSFSGGAAIFALLVLSRPSFSAYSLLSRRKLSFFLLHSTFFIERSFVALCYQLTPTHLLPSTFQRCSGRLVLFLPSALECRGRERRRGRRRQGNSTALSPPLSRRRVEMRESISFRDSR